LSEPLASKNKIEEYKDSEAVLIQKGLESLTKTANLVASIQNALEAKAIPALK